MPVDSPSMGPGEVLASVSDLGIRRGRSWLVRHVDLEVRRGEIVTLIGPNGGGKTTTAKALVGAAVPDEGKTWRAPGLRLGYVPQKVALDWSLPMTVRRMMSLTGRPGAAAVAWAMDAVGIAALADRPVQALSGGEFQRALLARAIVGRPQLLVLDEPVQGVDYSGELRLYQLIASIRDDLGCGILLVSHDLHIVMAQTDTVICLEGEVACRGAPQAVAGSPQYRRLFGDRAAGTLAVYPHDHDHSHGHDHGHSHAGHSHPHGDGGSSADAR